jgi:O-antigen/teichoic acid export membrane protein
MRRIPPGLIYTVALAISSALNFLALLVWANTLTPHEFGVYSLVLATALLINSAGFEWLRLITARMTADPKDPSGVNRARGNAVFAVVIAAMSLLAIVAIGLCLARVKAATLPSVWWPMIAAIVFSETMLAITNTLSRVRFLPWQFFRSIVARGLLSLLVGVVLVKVFGLGALGAVTGVVVAQTLVVISSLVLDPFWRSVRPFSVGREELATILKFGAPLILGCALNYAVGVADRYIIGFHAGTEAVGLYSAPFDLMQKTIVFIMLAINLTAFPALVRTFEADGPVAARAQLERNFLLIAGLGVPATVGVAVLAPGVAHMLLGHAFRARAAALLPWIAVAALFRSMVSFHLNMAFQLVRRTGAMIAAPAVCLGIIVLAGPYALARYGLTGMAALAAIVQISGFLVTWALAVRAFRFSLLSLDLAKLLVASAAMGAVLWPLRHQTHPLVTVALVALGATVFAGALLVLRFGPAKAGLARVLKRLKRA